MTQTKWTKEKEPIWPAETVILKIIQFDKNMLKLDSEKKKDVF